METPNLDPAVKAELDRLSQNFAKINDLEASIKTLQADGQGVAELKEQVNKIVNDNSEAVKRLDELKAELHKRVDDSEIAVTKRIEAGGSPPNTSAEVRRSLKSMIDENSIDSEWRGRADVEIKSISNLEGAGGDLLIPQFTQPILDGRQGIRVRQLLGGGTTTSTVIFYPVFRVKDGGNVGYQVAHFDLKKESEFESDIKTAQVRDISHWTHIARQMLSDVPYIEGVLRSEMVYLLDLFEEHQILNGRGDADDEMVGLNTAATAFDESMMEGVQAPNFLDRLRLAAVQVGRKFFPATGYIVHPEDLAREIQLLKNGHNDYLFANPATGGVASPWGLPVVESFLQPIGTALTGAFNVAADYWQREGVRVEISTEDGDNFRRNRATLLAEKRGTTAIKRPDSIVQVGTGSALTS